MVPYKIKNDNRSKNIFNLVVQSLRNLSFIIAKLRCLAIKLLFKLSNGKIDDVSLIYTNSYFKQLKKVEENSVPEVVKILFKHFHPKSVVDLGCGIGVYLKIFQNLGVDIMGYDRSHAAKRHFSCNNNYFVLADLRKITYHSTSLDLCLCFEMAEHIEEKYVDTFLSNVISFSKIIVFTAADVHQQGIGHVNLKPQRYWIKLFSERHFYYDQSSTYEIRKEMRQKKVIEWLPNNLMIFREK